MKNRYLINGFLESGKTTFIRELFMQGYFDTEKKTLIILCEEGEEEYDDSFCRKYNVTVKRLESEPDFTLQKIKDMEAEICPERVIIEFNGMWNTDSKRMQWEMERPVEIVIIDAQWFEIYLNNLKPYMISQIRNADMTIFRSCDGMEKKLAGYRRSIRAANPRTSFVFKDKNGEMDPRLDEDLPYDINKDLIVLKDEDFGIFYVDVMEYVRRYVGKRICFRGYIFKKKKNMFLIGREAVTCCMEDLTIFAFICDAVCDIEIEDQQWVRAEGIIKEEYFERMGGTLPCMDILWMEKSSEPVEKTVDIL